MKLGKFIAITLRKHLNENGNGYIDNLDYSYKFNKGKLDNFIKNGLKWGKKDFVEEYVYLNDIKFVKNYGSIIKNNNGIDYIYEFDIKLINTISEKGENIGTNWGMGGWLESMYYEWHDTVIIEDANTGYGIMDEIVIFNDGNIKINKMIKI